MKILLANLASALLKFHRELIIYQTSVIEKAEDKKFTPYELLNLSLNDPRFSWLRAFSDLIIKIDIIVDDKKNSPYDARALALAVRKAVSVEADENSEFRTAMMADPSLMLGLGNIRKELLSVEKALAAEIN